MALVGKRITRPVGMYETAHLLGNDNLAQDLASLCTSPLINKWARYKPVNHTGLRLTDPADYKGSASDITNGIIYGMEMRPATEGDLASLHSATYDYVGRPAGGESSPYRLTDFENYKHDAQPDLSGAAGMPIGRANPKAFPLSVDLLVRDATDYEVSVIGLLGDTSAADLLDYYPAVLVTVGSKGAKGYMHGLYSGEETSCHPIRYNGAVRSHFEVPAKGCPALSSLSANADAWVTFFLVSRTRPTSGGDPYGIEVWQEVQPESLWAGMRAYAVPGAAGLSMAFAPATSAGLVTIASASASQSAGITVLASVSDSLFGSQPQPGDTAAFTLRVRLSSGATARKSVTASYVQMGQGYTAMVPSTAFAWSDFGLAAAPTSAVTATITALVDGSTADTKTLTLDIT